MSILGRVRGLALAGGFLCSAAFFGTSALAEFTNADLVAEPAALSEALNDDTVRIIDVRPADAYKDGHIPGAVSIPADALNDPNAHIAGARLPDADLAALFGQSGIDNTKRVVIYDDRGGFHAARLFWMLEYYGHQDVAVLNGGFPRWEAEGLPVSQDAVLVEPTTFALNVSPRKEATADWLLAHESDESAVVVDVRPTNMFNDGHIPWAMSIPWKLNLTEDATLKSEDELIAHFAEFGVTPDKKVAIHCQNGKASAHSYWALRAAGFPRLRVYDRSWAEWGVADDLPKATM